MPTFALHFIKNESPPVIGFILQQRDFILSVSNRTVHKSTESFRLFQAAESYYDCLRRNVRSCAYENSVFTRTEGTWTNASYTANQCLCFKSARSNFKFDWNTASVTSNIGYLCNKHRAFFPCEAGFSNIFDIACKSRPKSRLYGQKRRQRPTIRLCLMIRIIRITGNPR